jgi:hypothetical protein
VDYGLPILQDPWGVGSCLNGILQCQSDARVEVIAPISFKGDSQRCRTNPLNYQSHPICNVACNPLISLPLSNIQCPCTQDPCHTRGGCGGLIMRRTRQSRRTPAFRVIHATDPSARRPHLSSHQAHTTTRAADAAVQVGRPRTAVPLHACNDLRPLPAAAPSHERSRLSRRSHEGVSDLATGDPRPPSSVIPAIGLLSPARVSVSVNLAMPCARSVRGVKQFRASGAVLPSP